MKAIKILPPLNFNNHRLGKCADDQEGAGGSVGIGRGTGKAGINLIINITKVTHIEAVIFEIFQLEALGFFPKLTCCLASIIVFGSLCPVLNCRGQSGPVPVMDKV